MKRTYTSKRFEEIVDKVRAIMPDAGITTDVMVGFPAEAEKHFMETYNFIEKIRFSRLHVFRYSPRRGTPATRMPKQVPPSVAFERSEQLRRLGERLMREFHENMISKEKEMEVLVENSREGKDQLLSGYTGNYIRTQLVNATEDMVGKMVKVRLKEVEGDAVRAEVIK
jgi:threonylcarbamoyladenosine tRNA methylthiotransferase MtaB